MIFWDELADKIAAKFETTAEYRKEIARVKRIRKGVEDVEKAIAKAEKEHEEKLLALSKERSIVRSGCTHEYTKYYGDPSGGNDSLTECMICGKEL